ncbi:hypothetical protein [Sulfurimonas sp.]|uniref:hypothetical protein n=1 Tax=Sulfurimonas sp. TaxID=2022749 RepID=UPI002AB2E29B|nr:hypothetical protein [Sulfurimonas sp.]
MNIKQIIIFLIFTTSLVSEDQFNTRFNYFGNLSASKLSSSGFYLNNYSHDSVSSDLSLTPYSKAGAQISINNNNFTFTAQGLIRKENDNYKVELTWLNLKYDIDDNFAIRGGRIQTKMLLHSESLDIDYLQLWAKPPVEVYNLMPIRTYDGIELIYDKTFNDYTLSISAVGLASFSDNINGSIEEVVIDVDDSHSFALELSSDMFKYKASYTKSKVNIEDDATTKTIVNGLSAYGNDMDRFTYENRTISVYSLGFQFRNNDFTLDSEIAYSQTNSLLASSIGAYMMVGYKINDFTPYIMYAENQNDKSHYDTSSIKTSDATSKALKRKLDDLLYLGNFSQSTASLGVRYDIKIGMALKMQIDRMSSTNYGSISSSTVQSVGYEKFGVISRESGTEDKDIYAFNVSFCFAY